MNRYSAYGQGDTQFQVDGDPGFRGLDMLHERAIVQPGYLARSENKRLRDGPAATRGGTMFPGDFNPAFTDVIIGSGIYSNPNGEEVMLVATKNASYIWQLQYGKDPIKINLYSDVAAPGPQITGGGLVNFVQAFDKVILLRIPSSGPPLIWDGGAATKFNPVALSANGLKLIPTTWTGEPFENRVLYYSPYTTGEWRTKFVMSDILDYSSYDDVFGVFKVSAAKADQITHLLGYQQGGLIAFMRNSIHMVENFTVDPTQTVHRVLSNRIGSAGYRMPLLVGREVFFLSEPGGFYKISQIVQNEIATDPIPISRNIQPIVDRINWKLAHVYASSAVLEDYAYFAVPLDKAGGASNAILVYNTVSQEWESAPDWYLDPAFRIDALHVTNYGNARRLYGLDYAASKIYLLYEGAVDIINGNSLPINDVMETRGYVCGDPGGIKKFERIVIGLRTSAPDVTVTALTDGIAEEYPVAAFTKDSTASYLHGQPTLIEPDDDIPKLEDNNATLLDFVFEDFENFPLGNISVLPASFFDASVKQQSLERFGIRQTGRWMSIRIENKVGQCDVLGVSVEGIPVGETIRTAA